MVEFFVTVEKSELLHDKSVKAWRGEHQEALFHYFNFTHCTKQNLRHYRQASSKLSIQKKYIYLQKHTTCHDSVCFTFLKLFNLPSSKHCKRRAFSAITYSNRLSVMWIRFIGHLLSCFDMAHAAQKQRAKTTKAHGSTGWSCGENQQEVKSQVALLAPFKSQQNASWPKNTESKVAKTMLDKHLTRLEWFGSERVALWEDNTTEVICESALCCTQEDGDHRAKKKKKKVAKLNTGLYSYKKGNLKRKIL